jgi:predicted AAA+ superfamily ATPase
MERKIAEYLLTWKNKPDKLPLLLQGARQVGKTYTLLSFGKQYYKTSLISAWRNPERSPPSLSAT